MSDEVTNRFAGPLPDSYWAGDASSTEPPGDGAGLLAGPYPLLGDSRADQRARVRLLLDAGVRTILDLRTPTEPPSARSLLAKLASDTEPQLWVGFPILNGSAPNRELMSAILDLIDSQIARSRSVYVHCQGGLGRAATVVACWWIRHERYDVDGVKTQLKERRAGQPHANYPSPETAMQYKLIESWTPGD